MHGFELHRESPQRLTTKYRKPNPLLIPSMSKINPLPVFIISCDTEKEFEGNIESLSKVAGQTERNITLPATEAV